jgi:hypothetical protein
MDTNRRDAETNEPPRETAINRAAVQNADLPDSPHDAERLKGEEATIDLPEVKDIPGQEFVHTAPMGMLSDTTISSDDEEGKGLFDETMGGDDEEAIPGA